MHFKTQHTRQATTDEYEEEGRSRVWSQRRREEQSLPTTLIQLMVFNQDKTQPKPTLTPRPPKHEFTAGLSTIQ